MTRCDKMNYCHLLGGDDRRVLLWNIDKTLYHKEEPVIMKGQHRSNIFCTVFDGGNRHLFSAGEEVKLSFYILLLLHTITCFDHCCL